MDYEAKESEVLQWHPAFYAGLQIELADDRQNLIFENEHQLGTKPKEIDVLIIKKEKAIPVRKNIGRIFRMHNIIEYKSPSDHLSIDDYYKVYGYACFYKADTGGANEIRADEITITLVSDRYPAKLIRHLHRERGYLIEKAGEGIYYVKGDYFPIQILVTRLMSKKENLWLRSLTNHLDDPAGAEQLINEYGKHKEDHLYASVMDIIVRANKKTFGEVNYMLCDALRELMKDDIQRELDTARQKGLQEGRQESLAESVLDFLSDLGEIPEDLSAVIRNEKDVKILKTYNKRAASAKSINEFRKLIGK